jgi:flagellar hook-associated protein 1 FlgK
MSLALLSAIMTSSTSGMRAAQVQLDIVSRNVSNANTEGYTRKEAPLQTLVGDTSAYGVTTGEVRRSVSQSLVQEIRTGTSIASALRTTEDYLGRLELAFGSPGDGASIAVTLGKLGDSFRALVTEPSSATLQQQTMLRAGNFATGVNALSDTIQAFRVDADTSMSNAITSANAMLREIDGINRSITQLRGIGKGSADLEDRRDTLLKKLADLIDIRTFERGTGEIVVTTRTGRELLDAEIGQLSFNPNPAISPDMDYSDGDLSGIILDGIDISSELTGGRLRGLLDVRDTIMASAQDQLDELTARVAQNFALCDLDLYSYGSLRPVVTSATATATMAKSGTTLQVSSAAGLSVGMNLRFANHPTTYVVSAISGTTVTIAQATGAATGAEVEVPSGTKMVFAAQPDTAAVGYARTVKVNPAVTAQPWRLRDGTSVAAIGSLPQASEIPRAVIDSFERVQPFTSNSGLTLTAYVGSLIVSQSTARAGAKDALSAREALNEQFDQRFSADSGVNVDSELALMVEIQTSYAASAKVLQATRQLMDELLQVVR